MGLCFKHFS